MIIAWFRRTRAACRHEGVGHRAVELLIEMLETFSDDLHLPLHFFHADIEVPANFRRVRFKQPSELVVGHRLRTRIGRTGDLPNSRRENLRKFLKNRDAICGNQTRN